jgi:N-acetylmuramoyl-L-alanine amidase
MKGLIILNYRVVLALVVLIFTENVFAGQTKVTNARVWDTPEYTRLVLDLSRPVTHQVMMLSKPNRLVLDIKNANKNLRFDGLDLSGSPIKAIRSARRNKNDLRVVLDLKEKADPKSFLLKPNKNYGDRLVVDLYTQTKRKASRPVVTKSSAQGLGSKIRDIIVVIDPGHGGEDPGAIGPNRIKEKDVVLAISKELKKQLNAKEGFRAYLTRERDYYVGLRKRTRLARKYNTDLLVSIHADAFNQSQAHGASVFALSNRGATSETARWLAKKENSADLIGGVGGVSLEDKDDVLASVLLDLSSTASLKASLSVGGHVLKSMGNVARLHKRSVQQAGFVVLKSPDIPSILVETGFISNPAESKRLKSSKYQRKIASAINKGLTRYFNDSPPPGTLLSRQVNSKREKSLAAGKPKPNGLKSTFKKYVVKKGDTLSQIAMRNDVSMSKLRRLNQLRSDQVQVGQRLQLPSS